MAAQVFTSSDIQPLAAELAHRINGIDDVFHRHFIVTGHNSTNDFLTSAIAENNGIAANIEYKRAIEFLEMVHGILEAGPKRRELFNPEQLVWLIDEIVSDSQFLAKHDKLKTYLGDEELKGFCFAEKIAGLFQSYQEDRPELIISWKAGKKMTDSEDEIWQMEIFNSLFEKLNHRLPDLTEMYAQISIALNDPARISILKAKLPSVSFFGNLPYTPELIVLIKALSIHVSVHIYYLSFESDTSNRIVRSFGQMTERQKELLVNFNCERIPVSEKKQKSVLSALQKSIMGQSIDSAKLVKDTSLTVSSSYTVSREVEALYHYLIRQFQDDPSLMMRDVCIISSDMETYAPAVNAFFSNREFKIDYTLYDTGIKIHASPYKALQTLLEIETDRFTSKNVLSLLEFDYIRDRFDINSDLSVIKRAVRQANIRHSIDGNRENETEYVSWRYGLKRLIYGSCLPPDSDEVTFASASFFPVDQFEETDFREIIKLQLFVETLHKWIEDRNKSRSLQGWVEFIEKETIEAFINLGEFETTKLTRVLSGLSQTADFYQSEVSFQTIRYFLKNSLGQLDGGEKKGYGGVRFVSPNTYLSSPVKVYCFIGMNASSFPRQVSKLSFDLSKENRLTKTEMDKNLFLNLLISAQDKVYISYIGQDVKDNSTIPPSTAIEELLAAVTDLNPALRENDFIVKHPLHSFSGKYNHPASPLLFQYRKDQAGALRDLIHGNKNQKREFTLPEENGKKIIQLNDLIRFIEDPVRHYFNKVLNIYYNDADTEPEEDEPFELDTLNSFSIRAQILDAFMADINPGSLENRLKKTGQLPLGNFGSQSFGKLLDELKGFIEDDELTLIKTKEKKSLNGSVVLDHFILRGRIDSIYDDTYAFIFTGSNKIKYRLRALFNYYFVRLCSPEVTRLFFRYREDHILFVSEMNQEELNEKLSFWCELYEKGSRDLIYYSSVMSQKESSLSDCFSNEGHLDCDKLNKVILSDTIQNAFEKSVFPSQYFIQIAKNDAFKNPEKANSFMDMHLAVIKETKQL